MNSGAKQSVVASRILSKRPTRRKFLKTALAAGAFGAVPLRGWAADPVNIGALYPTTGSATCREPAGMATGSASCSTSSNVVNGIPRSASI